MSINSWWRKRQNLKHVDQLNEALDAFKYTDVKLHAICVALNPDEMYHLAEILNRKMFHDYRR